MEVGEGFRAFHYVHRTSEYFLTVGTIDNQLGTLIQQALETLLAEIWFRGLFPLQASSTETFSRKLELNLDDLNISADSTNLAKN